MKKAIYLCVVFALVLAYAPEARATEFSSGDLIKASLPAVYYYSADGKRYVFPNEKTYFTWYSNFLSVKTITDAQLAAIQIGGNVTYKPGLKMVKIQTDPKTYAVAGGEVLRWVKSEEVAKGLYGNDWNKKIEDVPDAFFINYSVGDPIAIATDFSPAEESASYTSIDKNKGIDGVVAPPAVTYAWSAEAINNDTYYHHNLAFSNFNSGFVASWNDDRHGWLEVEYQKTDSSAKADGLVMRVSSQINTSDNAHSAYSGTYLYFVWEGSSILRRTIYLQKRDSTGSELSESVFASTTFATSKYPDIAWNESLGQFGIAWWDTRLDFDTQKGDLYFKRMTSGGTKTGADLAITETTSLDFKPRVISAGNKFVVLWQNDDKKIKLALVDSASNLVGTAKDVYTAGETVEPRLAWSGQNFMVVWSEQGAINDDVFYILLDADGNTVGSKVLLTTTASDETEPSIVWTGDKYYVSYTKAGDIYLQKINVNGVVSGEEVNIYNSDANSHSSELAVNGSVVGVAWIEDGVGSDVIMGAVEEMKN
ncbi:hypothetical protein ACFL29_01455 [Patescibacteria group bacterium]